MILAKETKSRFGYLPQDAITTDMVVVKCDRCDKVFERKKMYAFINRGGFPSRNFCTECIKTKIPNTGKTIDINEERRHKRVYHCRACGYEMQFNDNICDLCRKKFRDRRCING